jgi:hypothetical protein
MGLLMDAPVKGEFECTACKRVLPAEKYYWKRTGVRNSHQCRDCYQVARRPYQIAYMARIGKEKQRERYDPEKRAESVVKSYGLTLQKYDEILARQNGGCAICGSKVAKTKRNGRFCVDHDHETGEVRGLLCAPCNRGIGLLQDNPEILQAGATYLRNAKNPFAKAWSC